MSQQSDVKRTELRTMVNEMDLAMAGVEPGALREAWKRLVAGLDLGPEPPVRACPHCAKPNMAAATRCGHCWRVLTPTAT